MMKHALPCAIALALIFSSCEQNVLRIDADAVSGFTVSLSCTEGGSVSVYPRKAQYGQGETVTLKAVSDRGFLFSGWSGPISGHEATMEVTVDGNLEIGASFAKREWTVIVYMSADNDLESAAILDLNEMECSRFAEAPVSVLALVDRAPGYDTSNGDWTGTRLFDILNDASGNNIVISSREIACPRLGLYPGTASELDLSAQAVLQNLIAFAKDAYPAGDYALILWGHGTGWRSGSPSGLAETLPARAVALDQTSGTFMRMGELASALEGSGISVIGFDTCFGALVETAWELRNRARYLVGTEGVDPSTGWNYRMLFDSFAASALTAESLCASMQDQYSLQYSGLSPGTLSRVDLANLTRFRESFESFARVAAAAITDAARQNAFRSLVLESGDLLHDYSYPCDAFVDIGSLAKTLRDNAPSITDAATAGAIADASDDLLAKLALAVPSPGKIAAHLIPFISRDTPKPLHDAEYIKGSGSPYASDFVSTSTGWVPNAVPADSLLDALFYRTF